MTSVLNQNQKLFNHLSEEHGLILLESELQEVVRIVIEGLGLPTEEDIDQSSHRYYFDLEEKREKSKSFRGQIAGRHPDMLSSREMHSQMIGFVDGANFILNLIKGG